MPSFGQNIVRMDPEAGKDCSLTSIYGDCLLMPRSFCAEKGEEVDLLTEVEIHFLIRSWNRIAGCADLGGRLWTSVPGGKPKSARFVTNRPDPASHLTPNMGPVHAYLAPCLSNRTVHRERGQQSGEHCVGRKRNLG